MYINLYLILRDVLNNGQTSNPLTILLTVPMVANINNDAPLTEYLITTHRLLALEITVYLTNALAPSVVRCQHACAQSAPSIVK